jgi:hypothetical protein
VAAGYSEILRTYEQTNRRLKLSNEAAASRMMNILFYRMQEEVGISKNPTISGKGPWFGKPI